MCVLVDCLATYGSFTPYSHELRVTLDAFKAVAMMGNMTASILQRLIKNKYADLY